MKSATLLLLFLLAPCGFALEVSAPDNSWHLTVPEGFAASPLPPGKVLAAFAKPGADGAVSRAIVLEDLGATLSRKPLDKNALPANEATAVLSRAEWKSFPVDVIEVTEPVNGVPWLMLNAHIPLKPKAVQVKVSGPAERQADVRALLTTTLAGLDGETNWLTGGQRIWVLTKGLLQLTLLIALVAAPAVYFTRKKQKK